MNAFIALGSNLGDRVANLRAGIEGLSRRDLSPEAQSSVWETDPVGAPGPSFLNMVVRVQTELPPLRVLELILEVEREAGRVRTTRNAPRVLDLDLLLLGECTCAEPRLTLPHPRMWQRRFVLEPLAEIAPEVRDPATGRTVAQAQLLLQDAARVRKLGTLAALGADPL